MIKLTGNYVYLIVEKIRKDGNHHLKVGDILEGYALEEPEEGICFSLHPYHIVKMSNYPKFTTNVVQEIDFEKMLITTTDIVFKFTVDEGMAVE